MLGLAALRKLGPPAQHAVDQEMEIREIIILRCSWELLEVMAESDGVVLDPLLDEIIGGDLWRRARYALLGDSIS